MNPLNLIAPLGFACPWLIGDPGFMRCVSSAFSSLLILVALTLGCGGGGSGSSTPAQPPAGVLAATPAADGRSVALQLSAAPVDLDEWWVEMSCEGGAWSIVSPKYPTYYQTFTYTPSTLPDRTHLAFRAGGARKQIQVNPGPSVAWYLGVRGATWITADLVGSDVQLAWATDTTLASAQSLVERRLVSASGSTGDWTPLMVPAGARAMVDRGLPEGAEVDYRIRMLYQGESSPNLQASGVSVPLPPPSAVAAAGGVESIRLTWATPSAATQEVRVYETGYGGGTLVATLPGNATTCTLEPVSPQTHAYQVAFATARQEYRSAPVTAQAKGVTAPLVHPPVCGTGQTLLSWDLQDSPSGQALEVYRVGLNEPADVLLATLPPSATSYADLTAPSGLVKYTLRCVGAFSQAYSSPEYGLAAAPTLPMTLRRLPLDPVDMSGYSLRFVLEPGGQWWALSQRANPAGYLDIHLPTAGVYHSVGFNGGSAGSGRPPVFDASGRLNFFGLEARPTPWDATVQSMELVQFSFDGIQVSKTDLAGWFDPGGISQPVLPLGSGAVMGLEVRASRLDDQGAPLYAGRGTRVILDSVPVVGPGAGSCYTNDQLFQDGAGHVLRMAPEIPGLTIIGETPGYAAWDDVAGWQQLPPPPDTNMFGVYTRLVFVPLPNGFGVLYRPSASLGTNFPWRYCAFENGAWSTPEDVSGLVDQQEVMVAAAVQDDGGRPCLLRADVRQVVLHVREADGWKTRILSDCQGPWILDPGRFSLGVGYAPGHKLTAVFGLRTGLTELGPVFEFREP